MGVSETERNAEESRHDTVCGFTVRSVSGDWVVYFYTCIIDGFVALLNA